jgi:hypothetical protein
MKDLSEFAFLEIVDWIICWFLAGMAMAKWGE